MPLVIVDTVATIVALYLSLEMMFLLAIVTRYFYPSNYYYFYENYHSWYEGHSESNRTGLARK